MKLNNIFKVLGAATIALFAASCNNDYTVAELDALKVSQSYVSIPVTGGTTEVTLTATGSWAVSTSLDPLGFDYPDWLTVSPTQGDAGQTTISFSAAADENATNSTTLYIVETDGNAVKKYADPQVINVLQGVLGDVEISTCADVNAGTDGKTYRVKGKVTAIANTTYGNMYIDDGTGEVYVYGTLDADGAEKNFSSLGIDVGDIVTVQGPRTTYGTTIELVDVTVIDITKSLLTIDPMEISLGSAAADVTLNAIVSGDDLNFTSDLDWAFVKSITENGDMTVVSLHVNENTSSEARSGVITFTSSTSSASSSIDVTIVQSGLKGTTPDNPYTVAEAIAAIEGGTAGSNEVYVKGIVSQIDNVSTKYGNAQYWISDDGTTTSQIEVYRGLYFGSAKFTSENQIMTGWEVVVCGKLTEYNGTKEMAASNYIYSIEGATAAYTVAEALTAITTDCPTDKILVSGYIKGTPSISTQYGNAVYYISDDTEGSNELEVYRGKYFGGAKFTSEDQLAEGDYVTVVGNVVYFNSKTPEFSANSVVIAKNGKSSAE